MHLHKQITLALSFSKFMHRSVAWSNERHATPSYETCVLTGDRTQIEDTVTRDVTSLPQGQLVSG